MNTGYDIRYSILHDAQEMLMENWRRTKDFEQSKADRCDGIGQSYDPKNIPLPTADDIKKLAEDLYDFVQKK